MSLFYFIFVKNLLLHYRSCIHYICQVWPKIFTPLPRVLVFSPCVSHMCRCNYQYQFSCSLCNYHHHTKSCRNLYTAALQSVILHSTKTYPDKSFIFFLEVLVTTHSFSTWHCCYSHATNVWGHSVFLPTAGNLTLQCWGVKWNNVCKKSVKICQLIVMLKHQKQSS